MKIDGSYRYAIGWSVTVPQRSRLRLPSVRKGAENHESDEYLSYCIDDKNSKRQDASSQQPCSVNWEHAKHMSRGTGRKRSANEPLSSGKHRAHTNKERDQSSLIG